MIALREQKAGEGRTRVPEPMVMDTPESVDHFHAGGATLATMMAVYDLSARALDVLVPEDGHLLDLGVGSGRALHRFLVIRPDVTATGIDLAPHMLETARDFLDSEGVGARVSLVEADVTTLPDEVKAHRWDAVSSVWCLHHLPDQATLHRAVRQIAELREKHGSAVWILDFNRLRSSETMSKMTAVLGPDMSPVLRTDGIASEAAAFTQDEMRAALDECGLSDLDSGVARPIPLLQAFWSRGQSARTRSSAGRRKPEPLRGSARVEAAFLRAGFTRLPG